MSGPRAALALAAALTFLTWQPAAHAQAPRVRAGSPIPPRPRTAAVQAPRWPACRAHVELRPGFLKLGERTVYEAWIVVPQGESVRWIPPRSGGSFTWGRAVTSRTRGFPTRGRLWALDTVRVRIPLQIFALGRVTVPGVQVWLPYVLPLNRPSIRPMPTVAAVVTPLLAAADSAADLRPLRGPLEAPWWERLRWRVIGLVALGLIGAAALVLWARRRRPKPAIVAPARRRDPMTEALAELAALRRLALPARGRFAEHAFHLTRIVRRYLEATVGVTRPGDTTTELLERLRAGALEDGDLRRLEGLLRLWDGLKFARAASSVEEASRAESQAEALLRRPAVPAMGKVA